MQSGTSPRTPASTAIVAVEVEVYDTQKLLTKSPQKKISFRNTVWTRIVCHIFLPMFAVGIVFQR